MKSLLVIFFGLSDPDVHITGGSYIAVKNDSHPTYQDIINIIVIQCPQEVPEILVEVISHVCVLKIRSYPILWTALHRKPCRLDKKLHLIFHYAIYSPRGHSGYLPLQNSGF